MKVFELAKKLKKKSKEILDAAEYLNIQVKSHLSKLNESGLLSFEQGLWFQTPKKYEEFYNLENDPFELNNLRAFHSIPL